jgi:hypothetical protein
MVVFSASEIQIIYDMGMFFSQYENSDGGKIYYTEETVI